MRKVRLQTGFTLIEVIIVIALIAIAVAIAAPNLLAVMPNMRVKAAARDCASVIQDARMQAVALNANCAVSCDVTIGGVTYDFVAHADPNGDLEYNDGERVFSRLRLADFPDVAITGGKTNLGFNSRGLPVVVGGGLIDQTIGFRSSKGLVRQVRVNPTGNVRIQ
ncbi:MAG: GspH/FimT family protein [Desulfuromonadales bacterium]|nr:GspH/FimT family protein [Desulfuromonadales bacterium]